MGTGASDSTTLDFTFSGTYDRKFEIKVTQLPCSNEYRYAIYISRNPQLLILLLHKLIDVKISVDTPDVFNIIQALLEGYNRLILTIVQTKLTCPIKSK